ncbi:MAG TPA: DUF2252 family protein [Burkholderiales bacterium]|nr:DUF2252 family protein [Burkholderiales bacterium]
MTKAHKNIIDRLLAFDAQREPERLALKYQAMRADPFAFLRGTCRLFYSGLPKGKLLTQAPHIWLCGDLHLENFGSYKGDNGLVYFDVNDFDDAVLGPVSWDVLRFVTSLLTACEARQIARPRALTLSHAVLNVYTNTLIDGKARWLERETANGAFKALLDQARARKRAHWLDSRTVLNGERRKLRLDARRAIAASAAQRAKVRTLLAQFAEKQSQPRFYRVIDVARRITGMGSLGVERYVILVEGKGSPDENHLLDLKQAVTPAAASLVKWKQPKWKAEAARVVSAQRRILAVEKAHLHELKSGEYSYVLADLQPSEDRLSLKALTDHDNQLEATVATLARVVAWGHLRGSGHEGAASAQELADFWSKAGRRRKLLQMASECAAEVRVQWEAYCEEFDRRSKPAAEAKAPSRRRARSAISSS